MAPSNTEKAEHRRIYTPGTDISPTVQFISSAVALQPLQDLVHNSPLATPARVFTPVIDEVLEEISRPLPRVENVALPIHTPLRPSRRQDIARRPESIASSSLEELFHGQPPARAPASTPNSQGYGGTQYANTINNHFYYGYGYNPVPQQHAQPTPTYSPYGVSVNGAPLDTNGYLRLSHTGIIVQPGNYWYDQRSGLYGVQGGPCIGQISPAMNLGGPLASNASGYPNTNIYINGREIHLQDLLTLKNWGIFLVPAERYWLEANGTYGRERMPHLPEGNLMMNATAIVSSYIISKAMSPSCVIL
ncbi:hypothetical protein B0J11DRAFT_244102 [Dendryphion nanum]|uniref:Uncharacterized protein n=1 Tax=Dendryphion nanum TaxID=256645 RepID=A0A9P9E527_9PLEO|nr:hypothetical protein B0J11DRAFT_244102 [Dendryphion nanum]